MNKMLNDLLPAIVFFAVYKMYNIFYATAALIIITVAQVIWDYVVYRKIDKMKILIAVLVIIFGGATLFFHNEEFIKWKVSIINWLLGVGLIACTYIMKEPPMKKLLQDAVSLDETKWRLINNVWGVYFIFLGTVNIIVAMYYSTDIWMDFKMFGLMGMTIVFLILQSIFISKWSKK